MELQINKKNIIYFIGIGGIGMSGIALIMKNLGYSISGSDLSKNSKVLDQLKKNKIKIIIGHNSKAILKADIVVVSTAIKSNNKEYVLAKKNKIIIIKRADMLAHLINLKKNIIVSGSHGKTTITSLISHLLKENKFYPTIVNGGIINSIKSNAILGKGEWAVVEADESDGSFLKFKSIFSIVSNIDFEHMDYYKNFKNLKNNFEIFLKKTPLLGKNIVCIDDKNLKSILNKINKKNSLTYGFSEKANLQCKNVKYIELRLLGVHNILNATATFAVGLLLNINITKIKKSLLNFSGVQRRLTLLYNSKSIIVYDDYAHHPTEIKAVLNACKNNFKNKKIIAIFQPHRYSRVMNLYKEFTKSFVKADQVLICPVYSAGEKNKHFNYDKFCRNVVTNSKTKVIQTFSKEQINLFLKKNLTNNQVVIAMGAGNISVWIRDIVKSL